MNVRDWFPKSSALLADGSGNMATAGCWPCTCAPILHRWLAQDQPPSPGNRIDMYSDCSRTYCCDPQRTHPHPVGQIGSQVQIKGRRLVWPQDFLHGAQSQCYYWCCRRGSWVGFHDHFGGKQFQRKRLLRSVRCDCLGEIVLSQLHLCVSRATTTRMTGVTRLHDS